MVFMKMHCSIGG